MADDPKTTIPVLEETLSLSTRRVVTGRVRIATRTEERDHILPAELASAEVDIVRVPVDRRIDVAPEIVTQGDLTIIPVVEERLVVVRELYLREEIHVRRIERMEAVDVHATTRHQTVHIDRIPVDPTEFNSKDHDNDL